MDTSKVLQFFSHREVGGITEVRIFPKESYLNVKGKRDYVGKVISGYYDDYTQAAKDISWFDGKGHIYFTLNPVKRDLLARAANRLQRAAKVTTTNDDILMDMWLFLDFDAIRPADISSSNAELEDATKKRDEVFAFLSQWCTPIKAMSGNGSHLLVRVAPNNAYGYTNSEEIRKNKARIVKYLSQQFSDDTVSVDDTVFNMSRLCKLYGTMAVKGDNIPERPHRRSFLEIPSKAQRAVDLYAILAAVIPKEEAPKYTTVSKTFGPSQKADRSSLSSTRGESGCTTAFKSRDEYPFLEVEAYLANSQREGKCGAWRPKERGQSALVWYQFEDCPIHTDPDGDKWECGICQHPNGKMGAKCMHDPNLTWQNFKEVLGDPKPFYHCRNGQKYGGTPFYHETRRTEIPKGCDTASTSEVYSPKNLFVASANRLSKQQDNQETPRVGRKQQQAPPKEKGGEKISADVVAHNFLNQFGYHQGILKLRYYRQEWWQWNGFTYEELPESDLRALVAKFVDEETTANVTKNFTSNVIETITGQCLVSSKVVFPAWLDEKKVARNEAIWRILNFQNGWLDLDMLISDEDVELQPHTPQLFSINILPYPFQPDADCPQWSNFLHYNLEGDVERHNILQDFAGYCLLSRNLKFHKFLLLEGEAGTGKSTFCKVLRAMIGEENISNVPLELFGDRFSLYPTLGKLANIVEEVGELDTVAEGQLKAFTSGAPMQFERKFKDAVMAIPTAKLILATNNRPRLKDRSAGIWRRMILVPWLKVIPENEMDRDLDAKIMENELPGVFLWALAGLERLLRQNGFSPSKVVSVATEEYKLEENPTRIFLEENYQQATDTGVECKEIYSKYVSWCRDFGYEALNNIAFGKEVRRTFPKVENRMGKDEITGKRERVYWGITPKMD